RIAKGIDDRRGRDVEDRPCRRRELKSHDAVDDQAAGHALKHRGGDGIAEDIVRPRNLRRRRNGHRARNQPQVTALAWAKHKPMRSETDQPPIAVSCPVMDLERNHRRILASIGRTSFIRRLRANPRRRTRSAADATLSLTAGASPAGWMRDSVDLRKS